MLLIRKRIIIILMLITTVSIILIAAMSYNRIIGAYTQSPEDLKFEAEQFLFISLLVAAAVLGFFIVLLYKSRNINAEIDKLIKQDKLNPASTEAGLLKLGKTGIKLNSLYRQINEISDMRGLKLGAVSNVAEFLSLNIPQPLLIIDLKGTVIQASSGYLREKNVQRSSVVGRNISSLLKSINMKAVLSVLEKNHLPAEIDLNGTGYRWSPLHNTNNEISYIAVIQISQPSN